VSAAHWRFLDTGGSEKAGCLSTSTPLGHTPVMMEAQPRRKGENYLSPFFDVLLSGSSWNNTTQHTFSAPAKSLLTPSGTSAPAHSGRPTVDTSYCHRRVPTPFTYKTFVVLEIGSTLHCLQRWQEVFVPRLPPQAILALFTAQSLSECGCILEEVTD